MKRIFAGLLAATLCAALMLTPALAVKVKPQDLSQVEVTFDPAVDPDPNKNTSAPSAWAKSEIDAAIAAGLVPALSGSPRYQDPINRLQFAELAVNLVEVTTGQTVFPAAADAFTDCDSEAVRKASAAGIVNGVGDGRFAPADGLTREQLATMLYRAWAALGDQTPTAGLEGYEDAGDVSSWAADAVGALASSGIMKGTSDTTLTPQGPCTVEQSILLVYRLYQQVGA